MHLKFHGFRWKTFIAILLPSNDQSKLPRGKVECFHATVMHSSISSPICQISQFFPSLYPSISLLSQVYMSFHDERCAGKFSIVFEANSRQKSIKIFQRLNFVCLAFTSNPISPLSILFQSLVKICYHA